MDIRKIDLKCTLKSQDMTPSDEFLLEDLHDNQPYIAIQK